MLTRILLYLTSSFLLVSCLGKKPFQPPPPEYTMWIKEGISEEEIKQAMKDCGYKDLYGYGDRTPANDVALRQICMFKKGFVIKGGYKGLCSLAEQKHLPACSER